MTDKHRRRRPQDDFEPPDDPEGIAWDDTVDVVCVGVGVTATAAAVAAVKLGLTVLRAAPASTDDEAAAEYLRQVTDDIPPAEPDGPAGALPVRLVDGPSRVRPEFPVGTVTFVGASLRDWAGQCLPARGGVLSTTVVDPRLTVHYTGADEHVEAVSVGVVDLRSDPGTVAEWAAERARDEDVPRVPVENLAHLVFDDGRVAGVAVTKAAGDSELELVRARYSVILALRDDAELSWPQRLDAESAELAFVTRAASRFGRLELLVRNPGGRSPR